MRCEQACYPLRGAGTAIGSMFVARAMQRSRMPRVILRRWPGQARGDGGSGK